VNDGIGWTRAAAVMLPGVTPEGGTLWLEG
jgi:hypothetical protein